MRRDDVKANGTPEGLYKFWLKCIADGLRIEDAHRGDRDQNRVIARAWVEECSWRA